MQTTRATQIQVRVDCNGCVQKIKKALNGINGKAMSHDKEHATSPNYLKNFSYFAGIHDLHVDFRQQKLTITGWADPEKIVKAIKTTRKNANICAYIELTPPSQPTEPEPKGNAPAPDATQLLPPEAPPAQASPPVEPPHEATTSSSPPTENNASQQRQSYPGRKDAREVHVIHHHLPNYVDRISASPIFVSHSYNTYMPSHYVTEYEYLRAPPTHTRYNLIEHYGEDYPNGNGGIASMFSDDNPNACCIV